VINLGSTVYLARHGQTEWNVARRRQGQLDSPLTTDGLAQAAETAALLDGRGIDAIFASPLGRATDTANIIAEALDRPVVIVGDLAEVNHGHFAGLTNDEIRSKYPGALETRSNDKYEWRFPGGESYADADQRAERALELIASHHRQRPLLVSHEMIGRMLLRQLVGLTPNIALTTNQPHNVIYEIDSELASVKQLQAEVASQVRCK
jgi:broad specificity phosphatase PhoE